MAKFVRWLGAFRRQGADLSRAAVWEISQTAREVAVEPLFRGESFILAERDHVSIGLVVAPCSVAFRAGALHDNRSGHVDGVLVRQDKGRESRPIRDMDKFLRLWGKAAPTWHGEAWFAAPTYVGVALRMDAVGEIADAAQKLAAELGLPLVRVRSVRHG